MLTSFPFDAVLPALQPRDRTQIHKTAVGTEREGTGRPYRAQVARSVVSHG